MKRDAVIWFFTGVFTLGIAIADETSNLVDWADLERRNVPGKAVPEASWDGSTAIKAIDGTPWFGIRWSAESQHRYPYSRIRGHWLKIYFDTRGGGFGVALMDLKTREFTWLAAVDSIRPTRKDIWIRQAATFKVPDKAYASPTLYFYGGRSALFDNLRLYHLGTEPESELAPFTGVPNPDLMPLLADPTFAGANIGAVAPPEWNLLRGGVRAVADAGRDKDTAMVLDADSVVATMPLLAEKDVPVTLSFWMRGRGKLSVYNTDLDSAGYPLKRGADAPGNPIVQHLPATKAWRKIELQSNSYSPLAAGRRIELRTGPGAGIVIDEVTIERDLKAFPLPAKAEQPFTGEFTSPNAKLTVTLGGKPIDVVRAITGPTVLLIKATSQGSATPLVTGGLTFEDGGIAGADSHWRWTAAAPADDVDDIAFDDSAWQVAHLRPPYITLNETTRGDTVWFRRVVLWNLPRMFVPDLRRLPIADGFIECLTFSLNPPSPKTSGTFELTVDLPPMVRLLPIRGVGAYWRQATEMNEVTIGDDLHRYQLTFNPDDITGAAGSGIGPGARSSSLIFELDGQLPGGAHVRTSRIFNHNHVELPVTVPLIQVSAPDGTRPKDIMFHCWNLPYVYSNAPDPTFNIEIVDRIMALYANAGFSDSAWQAVAPKPGHRPDNYALDPAYGRKWAGWLADKGTQVQPVWHVWPLTSLQGTPTYDLLKQNTAAVASRSPQLMPGSDEPELLSISAAWVLSPAAAAYWEALRSEYAYLRDQVKRNWNLPLRGVAWDYEFEINSYGGGYDALTLAMFRQWAGLPADTPLDRAVIHKQYSGQYRNFSRDTCRRLIQMTKEKVFDPLGLRFHVYYGEGRPFDPGNCHIISAWRLSQNVSRLIPSVKNIYDRMTSGIERAPDVRFLSILQPEQLSNMTRRQMDFEELTTNIIKRTVAVRGGGNTFFYTPRPFSPGMYYGIAAAARFLAEWEDYFHDFEPVFAGSKLAERVTITPPPADVVLLKKGTKGLLLVFADVHEKQSEVVEFSIMPRGGQPQRLRIGPGDFGAVEMDIE